MTHAVVGCSDCSALWVVETGERRDRRCPRCGRTYRADTRPRRRLSTHATQQAAREARSRRLAERCNGDTDFGLDADADPHTAEAGDRPFYADDLADLVDDVIADPFADAVDDRPFYADAFAHAVDDSLDHREVFADLVDDCPFYADDLADELDCKRTGVAASPPSTDDRPAVADAVTDVVAESPECVPIRSLADSIYQPDATDTEYAAVWRAVDRTLEPAGNVETTTREPCREVTFADEGVLDTAGGGT